MDIKISLADYVRGRRWRGVNGRGSKDRVIDLLYIGRDESFLQV